MNSEIKKEAEERIKKYVQDWNLFAEQVLGVNLDDEQKAVLTSVQNNKRTSVRSGTSRGKDFVAAVAAVCFFYLTPKWNEDGEMVDNTKVCMSAPTERQVSDIMFAEVARLFNRAQSRNMGLPGRLSGYGIRTDNKEWFLTGFKADGGNVEAWTGFHAANTMFVVTEASGMPDLVFNAIEGNLHGNCRILLVFNDNRGKGYASETQRSDSWSRFTLDSLNAPNVVHKKDIIKGQVSWETINEQVKMWCDPIDEKDFNEIEGDFFWTNELNIKGCYRPSSGDRGDLFRTKVRGMAPKSPEGTLIPYEWIEAANKRYIALGKQNSEKAGQGLRLGVDVAGMGRDSTTFCFRYRNYVEKFESQQSGGKADHMAIAGKTKQILESATSHVYNELTGYHDKTGAYAFIDTIGEGAGVFSRLREQGLKNALSCKYSEAPEYKNKPLKDSTGQHEFYNMKAYLYWSIRDWLDPYNKNNPALPPDQELAEELTQTEWEFLSNGKIKIEAKEDLKKRLKRSPDKADALANTFYPPNEKHIQDEIQHRNNMRKMSSLF
jgi:hypothetical protein